MIPGCFTSSFKALLGLVFAFWVFSLEPTTFAQGQSRFLDEPTPRDEAVADTSEIVEAAPLEASLPVPPPVPMESLGPGPAPVPKRLFGLIPNYRAGQTLQVYTPLTASEKFHIARSDSFDWPNYFLLAGIALQDQVAAGGFTRNGGFTGFGRFYARSLSDQIAGNYVTEAILPTLLHEDPRFFRLGAGTFWRRAYYAASRIFVIRMDNGSVRFNVSEIAGNAGVVAVTTLYYPQNTQSVSDGVERYGMQLGNDAITNLLTEFWPDIKQHLRFRRHYFP